MSFDPIATIQMARQQQLQSVMAMRGSNFQYSQPTPQRNQTPNYGFQSQQDTVTLSGRSYVPSSSNSFGDGNNFGYSNSFGNGSNFGYSNSFGNGSNFGYSNSFGNGSNFGYSNSFGSTPGSNAYSDANARLSNGQTIEELFNNPYANDPNMAYLKDALDQIAAARATYGSSPSNGSKKEGQKGDLRVIAGDRSDGVKPREVRIDDVNSYDYQKAENGYQDRRQEARFKDGTVGREYDVTVTWEDGSTTKKRVTLDRPGQIVYMDSAYSY